MIVIPDNLPLLNVHSFKKVKEAMQQGGVLSSDYEIALLIQIYLKEEKIRMTKKGQQTKEQNNVYRKQSEAQHSRVSEKGRKPDKRK